MSLQTLLIVDDSMIFRNRIQRLATVDGSLPVRVVATAGDGVEALEAAKRHKPDLVTMDLTMPRMDGATCLESLRTVLPDGRILVVSALSDRATALEAMTRGAHGFLLKPFSDRQLVESLRELME